MASEKRVGRKWNSGAVKRTGRNERGKVRGSHVKNEQVNTLTEMTLIDAIAYPRGPGPTQEDHG